jgi:predicted transcriptional regulator
MGVLWDIGEASAEAIREALSADLHDSTVRTLLRVLESKGYVKHTARGKAYIYRPAVKRARAERTALRSTIKRFFGGSAEALVLRLIEDEQLTPEQLVQLKEGKLNQGKSNRSGGAK